ncbi:MAG: hypothetical protein ACPL7I_02175, partial [Myxococcota bacterium]
LYLFMSRSNSINNAEQERQELKNQNENLKREIEKTTNEVKDLREENIELKNKLKQIKSELYETETKNKDLLERLDNSEKKISEYEDNLRKLNIELENIKSKPSEKTIRSEILDSDNKQKQINELNNKIRELEKKISIYENEHKLEEYKNNIQLYQNRIKILEDQLAKIKTIAEEKSKEVASLKIKNENLDKAYMTIRGELASALDKISALKGEEGRGFSDETENKN